MDGYAVRADDVRSGRPLHVIGESRAGHRFSGSVATDETVRIFTGAPVPDGADAILIQENAEREGDTILPSEAVERGRYIRPEGFDFRSGDTLMDAGALIGPGEMVLLASANVPQVIVRARPRVAVIATGDELVPLGDTPLPDQIIASSTHGVMAILADAGADVIDCGIATDSTEGLEAALDRAIATDADLVITLGGASVGDHDLVRSVFAQRSVDWAFEKVAMRPGKPLMHGRDGVRLFLGLPGNPVSSLVCALVFAVPVVAAMRGERSTLAWNEALLGADVPANDEREEFMRVAVERRGTDWIATPFRSQDSSLTSRFARADALLHRRAHAPPGCCGEACRISFLGIDGPKRLRSVSDAG